MNNSNNHGSNCNNKSNEWKGGFIVPKINKNMMTNIERRLIDNANNKNSNK